MSGKYSELAAEAEALKSGASGSIFGLDQPFHFSLFCLPLCKMENEDAYSCLLGLDHLAKARAVKSHILDDAQLTSAPFFSALVPAPPSLPSPLCFFGPPQAKQSSVTATNLGIAAGWGPPLFLYILGPSTISSDVQNLLGCPLGHVGCLYR